MDPTTGWHPTAPVTELATEVRAENHLFHLVDTAAPPSGDPDDQPPTPRHDQLATTAPRTVTFSSALSDHYPHITLQHWTAPPPPPLPGRWPRHIRLTITLEGGRLALTSGISHLSADATLRLPPGHYTLAAYRDDPDPTREPLPHHAEHWLLQLWPR